MAEPDLFTPDLDAEWAKIGDEFERVRKAMVNDIAKTYKRSLPSMGPALLFIESPNLGLLYPWMYVAWDDLKLGHAVSLVLNETAWFLRQLARSQRVAKPRRSEIDQLSKDILFVALHNPLDRFLDPNISMKFDKYLNVGKRIEQFLATSGSSEDLTAPMLRVPLAEVPAYLCDALQSSLGRLRQTCQLLEYLGFHNQGAEETQRRSNLFVKLANNVDAHPLRSWLLSRCRVASPHYTNLRDLWNDMLLLAGKTTPFAEAVSLHKTASWPSLPDPDKWNEFAKSIGSNIKRLWRITSNKASTTTDEFMGKAISLFNCLPQETHKSQAYQTLRTLLRRVLCDLSTTTSPQLDKLVLWPNHQAYRPSIFRDSLYEITHLFERLFYGQEVVSEDELRLHNIAFIPIRFFPFQVIGQAVFIVPPSSKLPLDDIIATAQAHLPFIERAVQHHIHSILQADVVKEYLHAPDSKTIPIRVVANMLKRILHAHVFLLEDDFSATGKAPMGDQCDATRNKIISYCSSSARNTVLLPPDLFEELKNGNCLLGDPASSYLPPDDICAGLSSETCTLLNGNEKACRTAVVLRFARPQMGDDPGGIEQMGLVFSMEPQDLCPSGDPELGSIRELNHIVSSWLRTCSAMLESIKRMEGFGRVQAALDAYRIIRHNLRNTINKRISSADFDTDTAWRLLTMQLAVVEAAGRMAGARANDISWLRDGFKREPFFETIQQAISNPMFRFRIEHSVQGDVALDPRFIAILIELAYNASKHSSRHTTSQTVKVVQVHGAQDLFSISMVTIVTAKEALTIAEDVGKTGVKGIPLLCTFASSLLDPEQGTLSWTFRHSSEVEPELQEWQRYRGHISVKCSNRVRQVFADSKVVSGSSLFVMEFNAQGLRAGG